MVVIDLGCFTYHEKHDSVQQLIDRFHPSHLYGFDPALTKVFKDDVVTLRPEAAWTQGGSIDWLSDNTASRVGTGNGTAVPCFDFSAWLAAYKRRHPQARIILKMDIEGAEYPVLLKMITDGTDRHVELLLVEWHGSRSGREPIMSRLACPVEEWV